MTEVPTFDWWLERVSVARWNDQEEGRRDAHASCPACGGSDPLHITEKNGRALVNCFSCGAKFDELVEAATEQSEPEEAPVVRVTRVRRETAPREPSDTASAVKGDALAWYAKYCGVDLEWMRREIPVRALGDLLEHYWDSTPVMKIRRAGTSERWWSPKGEKGPRLWPQVEDELPEEVWLAEGETDVIVLRSYGLPAYTSGSVTTLLSAEEMRGLVRRGVQRVVIAYDSDREGLSATQKTKDAARDAGLGIATASPGDTLSGGPKDWRERRKRGDDTVPETDADLAVDNVYRLDEVEPAEDTTLILGRLHPTDHTVLFGDGATGKGVIASWWVAMFTTIEKRRVLVVDYEAHARAEWRPRIERFGGDLESVYIMQPERAIWDEAQGIREIIASLSVDYVVVDSVMYACLGRDVEKSETAGMYSVAIAQLHRPVLSLAHTTKADADPQHPFGSVFWSNGARVTIGVSRTGGLDSPRKLEVKKANQGGHFEPTEIDWSWVGEGLPDTLDETEVRAEEKKLGDELLTRLPNDGTTVTVAELEHDLDESGVEYGKNGVPKALQRLKKSGIVENVGRTGWRIHQGEKVAPGVSVTRRKRG